MIREAIEYIRNVAVADNTPKFVRREGDPNYVIWQQSAGALIRGEVDPPPRAGLLARISELAGLALRAGGERTSVWVGEEYAELVIDESAPYERFVVPLRPSREALFFGQRDRDPKISLDDLRDALRYELSACCDAKLVEQVSTLTVMNMDSAERARQRDQESFGTSITQQCRAPAGLPDESQVFKVRALATPEFPARYAVRCVLDPLPRERAWYLKPRREDLDKLVFDSVEAVALALEADLKDSGVPVWRGEFTAAGEYSPSCVFAEAPTED